MVIKDSFTILHNKGQLQLGQRTQIMAIVNLTPDSFSGDGFYKDTVPGSRFSIPDSRSIEDALEYSNKIIQDGADIIDVGGESARPGATPVSEEEELRRVIPLIKELSRVIDRPISIDTCKSRVADKALAAGAQIINDVSGLRFDKDMARVAAANRAPIIINHAKGSPQDMQEATIYNDLIQEIILFFRKVIDMAIDDGIAEDSIIIDPGIGFGKGVQHNLEILNNLEMFKELGRPIMIGASRKSFIGKILNKSAKESLFGSLAVAAITISKGANILRVHDVKETVDVANICDAIKSQNKCLK